MSESLRPESRAERLGRRVGLAVFAVLVCGITLTWTVQIIQQTFYPTGSAGETACRPGAVALIGAVRRARLEADAETRGERAAVTRFRAALAPEWDGRDALGITCRGDSVGEHALREIDRLRYAEEHATRYEAVDLARRRRDVATLERTLGPR